MDNPSRRRFLRLAGISAWGLAVAPPAWTLNKLVIVDNPLVDYPYREWEDLYRKEWVWDKIGRAAHCSNCLGNCAWKIYVKDGIVIREEQIAQYPRINDHLPDFNPRGCQKGAINSDAMYDGDRIRYPMKRLGKRGEGKWQRLSWDQALSEISEKILDHYQKHGPGRLLTTSGSGIQSDIRQASVLRFASLTGGIHRDVATITGDITTGHRFAYGKSIQVSGTMDRLFQANYILIAGCNPNVSRIPDAHFFWEAKYNGCRVVSVSPDYNPSAIHTDLWIPMKQGCDPYLYMSMVYVVLKEGLMSDAFVREQTDLPLLVREDTQRLLRQSDVEKGGREDIFYFWDERTGKAVAAPGSEGSDKKTINLGEAHPALEGKFQVGGISVRPAFESMRAEVMKYSPEATAEKTGINPSVVYQEAREFAKVKMAIIVVGFSTPKYSNGVFTLWAESLLMALTGHGGPTGEIQTYGAKGHRPAVSQLAIAKPIRIETGMGEWIVGEQYKEAKEYYDQERLKEQTGFNVDELQDMVNECVTKKWMPYWGPYSAMILWADNAFRRNKSLKNYREKVLALASEFYVNVNTRMDSTALWADYILPAASHYEAWETRFLPLHRFISITDSPVAPVGEAKPDWDIISTLCKKLQEAARRRGITHFEDPALGTTRNFDTIYDDFTMGGTLKTAYDATKWLIDRSPELGGRSIDECARDGFVMTNEKIIGPNHKWSDDNMLIPFGPQVIDKKPYPTLSGRITFYIDHDWFLKLKCPVPTARGHAGRDCTKFPLGFFSPHTRWGIHSNWRSNKYMLRLQRGAPDVYINPKLAASRGIKDGGQIRVFNSIGEFYAQAKFYPSCPPDSLMMEHAWEPYQFKNMNGLNSITAPMLQPLEMVGNWGHLKFEFFDFNPNQLAHTSGVDFESVES